jgi:hypothetical protein
MLGLYLLAAAAEVNCQSPAASRGYRIGTTRLTNNKNLLVGDIISLTSGVYYLSPIRNYFYYCQPQALRRIGFLTKWQNLENKNPINSQPCHQLFPPFLLFLIGFWLLLRRRRKGQGEYVVASKKNIKNNVSRLPCQLAKR